MLHLCDSVSRTCAGLTRRQALQVGGLSILGLSLADALRAGRDTTRPSREPACILLWLDGGPSPFETFDPKPNTPDTVRGPYDAIRTNVTGIQVSELMPMMAKHMDRCAIIRSMTAASSAGTSGRRSRIGFGVRT